LSIEVTSGEESGFVDGLDVAEGRDAVTSVINGDVIGVEGDDGEDEGSGVGTVVSGLTFSGFVDDELNRIDLEFRNGCSFGGHDRQRGNGGCIIRDLDGYGSDLVVRLLREVMPSRMIGTILEGPA